MQVETLSGRLLARLVEGFCIAHSEGFAALCLYGNAPPAGSDPARAPGAGAAASRRAPRNGAGVARYIYWAAAP